MNFANEIFVRRLIFLPTIPRIEFDRIGVEIGFHILHVIPGCGSTEGYHAILISYPSGKGRINTGLVKHSALPLSVKDFCEGWRLSGKWIIVELVHKIRQCGSHGRPFQVCWGHSVSGQPNGAIIVVVALVRVLSDDTRSGFPTNVRRVITDITGVRNFVCVSGCHYIVCNQQHKEKIAATHRFEPSHIATIRDPTNRITMINERSCRSIFTSVF
mmetsp:Transcript_10660/g.25659  ORF Transcript_10660/g.25659 Transcript_10660/m.25659 type:complete len:215 (-) Transcript_10660:80-724(-)